MYVEVEKMTNLFFQRRAWWGRRVHKIAGSKNGGSIINYEKAKSHRELLLSQEDGGGG